MQLEFMSRDKYYHLKERIAFCPQQKRSAGNLGKDTTAPKPGTSFYVPGSPIFSCLRSLFYGVLSGSVK